jgi:D-amino-acid oxidase
MRKDPDGPPVVEDVLPLVIEEGCGLRPARRDGIRLEVEWLAIGPQSAQKIPVIYNYGYVPLYILTNIDSQLLRVRHGGYGFQSSWGSAGYVLRLLQGALKDGEVAKDTLNELAAAKTNQAADPLKNSW